jgi:hypothetical protein
MERLHPWVEMRQACLAQEYTRGLMRPAARTCNAASEARAAWLAPSARRSLEQVQWADTTTKGRNL